MGLGTAGCGGAVGFVGLTCVGSGCGGASAGRGGGVADGATEVLADGEEDARAGVTGTTSGWLDAASDSCELAAATTLSLVVIPVRS